MDEVKQYIVDYIERDFPMPENVEIEKFNFLDEGYVDSIEFFAFLIEIENHFCISITEEEMQNTDIHTIGGLKKLILEKMKEI